MRGRNEKFSPWFRQMSRVYRAMLPSSSVSSNLRERSYSSRTTATHSANEYMAAKE